MLGFKIDLLRVGWNWTREAETVLGKKQCWHMQYKGKMIVWFLELIYMLYRGKEACGCVHNVENPLFLLVWVVSTTSHFAKRLKPLNFLDWCFFFVLGFLLVYFARISSSNLYVCVPFLFMSLILFMLLEILCKTRKSKLEK